ncbi:MAG TPA: aminoglycoside phosphotransferase family protein [Candidatus Saccharimonadales bacterium]|nr:aminoglycoside phosphotransferase family protein [Candidatus Saccharimonadales bacterium]
MDSPAYITEDRAESYIRQHYPEVRHIELVLRGYHNIVAITDKTMVFHFPRTPHSRRRQAFEAQLLPLLKGKLPLQVPEIIAYYQEPGYLVTSYISGQHASQETVSMFSATDAASFAEQVIDFMMALNQAVPLKTVRQLWAANPIGDPHEDWPTYLKRVLGQARFPDNPQLEQLAHQQYSAWKQQTASSDLPTITIHDDLHCGNLLFHGNRLYGILDFGYTKTGTAAQELRQLSQIDTHLAKVLVQTYCARTGSLLSDIELRNWAITTDFVAYCNRRSRGESDHPAFIRTRANLKHYFPKFAGLF